MISPFRIWEFIWKSAKKFSIFGFEIAFYGMIIGIGVILGVLMAERMAKAEGMDTDIIWDLASMR